MNIKEKVLILIGNKIDMDKRQVSHEEADTFAKNHKIKYFKHRQKLLFK